MTIKENIQKDKIIALKRDEKEKVTILGTVLGEFDRKGKNLSDDEYVRILKNLVNSCIECNQKKEAEILSVYLPDMLSEKELTKIIESFCDLSNLKEKKNIGVIMKYLKENHSGRYDGETANKIIMNKLN